jgi:N-acetylmuramic acid 6-phosphate etherase
MSLKDLSTERRNELSERIDRATTLEALRIINEEDGRVPAAVGAVLEDIAEAVDALYARIRDVEARLVYVGAGSSGRIGAMDASELKPTFDFDRAVVLMAGGIEAFFSAKEADEDDAAQGARDVENAKVSLKDCVIGLTASGRTPYTIGALSAAKEKGALTVLISCNPQLKHGFDHEIAIDVGPEVISGSTRMKSGTAQKLVLNMMSTVLMVKLGKVYRNMMVDVVPKNEKLIDRAIRIIMDCTGVGRDEAERFFGLSGRSAKVAIVMIKRGVDRQDAERMLEKKSITDIVGE